MKKYLGIVFALVLAVSLLMVPAVPVAAQGVPVGAPFFTTDELGVAGLSTERPFSGGCSAKLSIPAYNPDRLWDEARVVFNYEGNLNSIEGVSYQSSVTGGNNGTLYPMVVLAVDSTVDGEVDSWVCQWGPLPLVYGPLQNEWRVISFDGTSPVHVAGARTGLTEDHYLPYSNPNLDADTLDSLRIVDRWGDFTVLEVKVFMGMFTNLTEEMTAYVDDIEINGVVYSFDPTGSVSLMGVVSGITAISVTPTDIDFGNLYLGQSSSVEPITVSNVGDVAVDIATSVEGDFFVANLWLDEALAVGYAASLNAGSSVTPGAKVVVPSVYPLGVVTGTLTFEATAQ